MPKVTFDVPEPTLHAYLVRTGTSEAEYQALTAAQRKKIFVRHIHDLVRRQLVTYQQQQAQAAIVLGDEFGEFSDANNPPPEPEPGPEI